MAITAPKSGVPQTENQADGIEITSSSNDVPETQRLPVPLRAKLSAHNLQISLLIVAAYVVAGKLGLLLAFQNPSATPVWAPSGIAIAALLLLGWNAWPAIFVAAFIVNLLTAGNAATSLCIAAGNTGEALLGTYLVNRFAAGEAAFERQRTIFRFVLLAALLSTMVSATVGVSALALGRFVNWADYASVWTTWWMGDAVGAVLVTPLIVGLWRRRHEWPWSWKKVLEALALAISLGLTGLIAATMPLRFLCIPFLLWAAFRFGVPESAAASLVVAASAIWGAAHGRTLAGMDINEALVLSQCYSGVLGVMTIAVAAVVQQYRAAEETLRRSRDALAGEAEVAGQALADAVRKVRLSEANFRRLLQTAPDAMVISDAEGKIVLANAQAERLFGYSQHELQGESIELLVPERFRANHPAHRRIYNTDPLIRPMGQGRELYGRRRDGTEFPAEISLSPLQTETGAWISSSIRDITERKQAEETLQALAGKLISAQEDDRRRIGRELHDDFSQRLALVAIRLDQLRLSQRLSSAGSPQADALATGLAELAQQISDLNEGIHRLSHGLHPALLEQLGLLPALFSLVEEFSERYSIAVRFAPDSVPPRIPREVSLCLFRVVQQTLESIITDSSALSVRVDLAGRTDGIHLVIQDDGSGSESKLLTEKAGVLRERLRLLRGHLHVRSAPLEGTRVDVWIPSVSLQPE